MDFTPVESQQAVATLAAEVLDAADPWKELARAGCSSAPTASACSTSASCSPRSAAAPPVPALATLMTGALPLLRWGRPDLLSAVASGELILTGALREPSDPQPDPPATAITDGTITGTKIGVLYAQQAHPRAGLLAPPPTGGVALVDPRAEGVTLTATPSSSGQPEYTLRMAGAPVQDVLGGPDCVRDLYQLAVAGACALADGAVAGALALTRDHVATRHQFGRPLAAFQAVSQQIADVYVASRTLHLATLSACWRLDAGLDAGRRPRRGGILVRGAGPTVRSDLPSSARRARDGRDLSLAPVFLPGRRPGPVPGRRGVPAGAAGMFLDLTPDQLALRAELRAYFAGLITQAERAELLTERHGAAYRDVVRRMGRDGWLGVGWPVRYGGRGFGQVEQQIFANEAARADVPLPAVTLQTVGPTLKEHGTPWQQDFFLPRILAGEVHFAIGYTEPEAGTDLASLRTRAVRDGDEYVVDGQKIFTTGAHEADYIWLACRTAPPRHKGITILIVDTPDPGFSWTPIITHDGAHHVNATYYSDVRVPVSMRVGEENEGWRLITTQLNHERVMLGPAGPDRRPARPGARLGRRTRRCSPSPTCAGRWPGPSAAMRVNELLNWQVAAAAAARRGRCVRHQGVRLRAAAGIGQELTEMVGRHGDPADADTAELALAGRAAQAQHRADLRRRRQRGPARADRHRRPRPAAGAAMTASDRAGPRSARPPPAVAAAGESRPRAARDPVNLPDDPQLARGPRRAATPQTTIPRHPP